MVAFGGSLGCMARLAKPLSVSQASSHYLVYLQAAPQRGCWWERLACIPPASSMSCPNQSLRSSSRTFVSTLYQRYRPQITAFAVRKSKVADTATEECMGHGLGLQDQSRWRRELVALGISWGRLSLPRDHLL
jgi:hypothetical protein